MKKLLLKRALAAFIDFFCIALFFEVIKHFLPLHIYHKNTLLYILFIFIPYYCKDIVFRNASIGKLLMGLVVVSLDWEPLDIAHSVKRAFLSHVHVFCTFWAAFCINKEYFRYFVNEHTILKAIVVERKVLQNLKEKAESEVGLDPEVMTTLYKQYYFE